MLRLKPINNNTATNSDTMASEAPAPAPEPEPAAAKAPDDTGFTDHTRATGPLFLAAHVQSFGRHASLPPHCHRQRRLAIQR